MDVTKAYDSINHELLLAKLNKMGIRGVAGKLLESYLCGRKQKVRLSNGVTSQERMVKEGVPQGSALGSILFIAFTNDLPNRVEENGLFLYADDTNLLEHNKEIEVIADRLQRKTKLVIEWHDLNGLKINAEKSALILFMNESSSKKHLGDNFNIQINEVKITPQPHIKYLGLIMDTHLKWNEQINDIIKMLNKSIPMLIKMRNKLSEKNRKLVYNAIIESRISFTIDIWGNANKTLMGMMQRKQNVILRIIFNKKRTENIQGWMKKNKILDVYAMNLNKNTKNVWKKLNSRSLTEIWKLKEKINRYQVDTRNSEVRSLEILRWNTEKAKRSHCRRMIQVANLLEKEGEAKIKPITNRDKNNIYPKEKIRSWWNNQEQEVLISKFW